MTRLAAIATLAMLLAGCALLPPGETAPTESATASSTPTSTAEPALDGPVQPVGTPTSIVTDLIVPWSILRLGSGSTLISERGTAVIKELTPDGEVRVMARVPGVVPNGEALQGRCIACGLIGLLNRWWLIVNRHCIPIYC